MVASFANWLNVLQYLKIRDLDNDLSDLQMRPIHHARSASKTSNDADSCRTLRLGVHTIYLAASLDAQAGAQVQTGLSWGLRPCTCWVRINEMDLSHVVCLPPTRRSVALKRESQGLIALALPARERTRLPASHHRPAQLAAYSACG